MYFILLKYGWGYWNEPRSQKEVGFIKSIRPQIIVLVGIGICLVGSIVSLVLLGEAISSTSENLYIVDDYQDDLGIQLAEIEFYSNFRGNNEKFGYLFI